VKIYQSLQEAARQLEAVSESSSLDAEILLAYVLGKPRSYLRSHDQELLTSVQTQFFNDLIARRLQREPVSYLTGHKEFWSLDFVVNDSTLIPRPDTEILVDTALAMYPDKTQSIRVLDLGTGCGAIALALASERPQWKIFATDVNEKALDTARENARRLRLNNISFYCGSWYEALPCDEFDLIVSNPPYLSDEEWPQYSSGLQFEPRGALVSGKSGLEDLHHICESARKYIRGAGSIILEHGFQQGMQVREMLQAAGCSKVRTVLDLAGRERVAVGQFYTE
jgi:release factor glutamine methyltransferase